MGGSYTLIQILIVYDKIKRSQLNDECGDSNYFTIKGTFPVADVVDDE